MTNLISQSNPKAVHKACQLKIRAAKQDVAFVSACAFFERTSSLLIGLVSIVHNGCVNCISHQIAQNDSTLFG